METPPGHWRCPTYSPAKIFEWIPILTHRETDNFFSLWTDFYIHEWLLSTTHFMDTHGLWVNFLVRCLENVCLSFHCPDLPGHGSCSHLWCIHVTRHFFKGGVFGLTFSPSNHPTYHPTCDTCVILKATTMFFFGTRDPFYFFLPQFLDGDVEKLNGFRG